MRGNDSQIKVHFKGAHDDFIVMAESAKAVEDWKKDSSIPLVQVVDGFHVFCTHNQGNTGVMDAASKSLMENEFGTSREDDVVKLILEKGTIIQSGSSGRDGVKNETQGGRVAH